MRTVAAMVAGLLLSMTTFAAGLVVALIFLNVGEPEARPDGQDTATLWTTEPVAVEKATQSFERLPPRTPPKEKQVASISLAGTGAKASTRALPAAYPAAENPMVDPITTGSMESQEPEMDSPLVARQVAAHVEWCSRRYRSYRPEDNTYRPYGGGRRSCQSPHSNVHARNAPADDDASSENEAIFVEAQPSTDGNRPEVEQASFEDAPDAYVDTNHVRSCFARYRSYRPADNSYQPFDDGPRRQCR
jgi:hypothetical protein